MKTPWGKSEQQAHRADGIVFHTTACHGGFKLDRKRNAQVPVVFRNSGGWYEEDCEAAKVIISFPQYFTPETVEKAHKAVKNYFPDEYEKHFNITINTDASIVKRERIFRTENVDNFVVIAAWGDWHPKVPKGGVIVLAKKQSTGQSKYFIVPDEEYKNRDGDFVIKSHPECEPII